MQIPLLYYPKNTVDNEIDKIIKNDVSKKKAKCSITIKDAFGNETKIESQKGLNIINNNVGGKDFNVTDFVNKLYEDNR